MAWRECQVLDQRREFCLLASLEGANVSALCARFGISRQTGYLWLKRHRAGEVLEERSRRPASSPWRSPPALEAAILDVRDAHPAWGARKIAQRLEDTGTVPPAVSTVHQVLVRHERVGPEAKDRQALGRFEREAPNLLWQMDFKGRTKLTCGTWCHTLTVVDDHSRYAVALAACANEQGVTVREHLERALRHHGLPQAIYVDNGRPWGTGKPGGWTTFRVWLLKLGIELIHARPYHPQGRGKNERFHRSLKAEVFALTPINGLQPAQRALDRWREVYNHQRPHQGIAMAVPASRYRPSPRSFPSRLPAPRYDSGEILRRLSTTRGYLRFKGRYWRVPDAFCGETLAIRPRLIDGQYGIFFGATQVGFIDLTAPQNV